MGAAVSSEKEERKVVAQVWNAAEMCHCHCNIFSDASQVKQTEVNSLLEIKRCDLGQVFSKWVTLPFLYTVYIFFVCVHEKLQQCVCLSLNVVCLVTSGERRKTQKE